MCRIAAFISSGLQFVKRGVANDFVSIYELVGDAMDGRSVYSPQQTAYLVSSYKQLLGKEARAELFENSLRKCILLGF